MPQTIFAEAHLFLSRGRSKISLDYLSGLLQLGADPFRDPELEGLEGQESLIYASKVVATLVVPARPLAVVAPSLAKGLVRLLLTCPRPSIRLGQEEVRHLFSKRRAVRWQIRLATRPLYQFGLGPQEFFVVTRFVTGPCLRFDFVSPQEPETLARTASPKRELIWIGVLGRKKKRAGGFTKIPTALVPALDNSTRA